MSIRKTPTGWRAEVDFGRGYDGKRDRRSRHCRTKKEAQAAERAMIVERDAGNGSLGRVRFADFLEHVYWPQKTRLRASTRAGYERDLNNRLLPAFGHMYLHEINRLGIQKMLLACPTEKVARNARATLSAVLRVAVEMGLLSVNPAGFTYQYPQPAPKDGARYGDVLPTFASHAPVLLHLAKHHAGEPVERMAVLGLCFGLRKGEILGLDWEQVDLEGRTIDVVQTYTSGKGGPTLTPPKTARSVRTIPMPAYAWRRMRSWGVGSGPIVTNAKGGRLSPATAKKMMRAAMSETTDGGRALPHLTLYSCRHSFATACINAGIEVSTVSAWLGHRDVSTTYNRYVRHGLGDLQSEVGAIDAAMGIG